MLKLNNLSGQRVLAFFSPWLLTWWTSHPVCPLNEPDMCWDCTCSVRWVAKVELAQFPILTMHLLTVYSLSCMVPTHQQIMQHLHMCLLQRTRCAMSAVSISQRKYATHTPRPLLILSAVVLEWFKGKKNNNNPQQMKIAITVQSRKKK